ncbi:MAG: homocysteine S-methyltransferase family protein [Gammaproteobacteria bacterium]|nr:homocysteine S-methyltransferase family protein [Gammaproteobacteria bacterium]
MKTHRDTQPQLAGGMFLTEGGIGTTLIHRDGVVLPHFATWTLLATPAGTAHLRRCFAEYAALARRLRVGIVIDSVTWRGSADWGARLGVSPAALAAANRDAIALLEDLRREYQTDATPVMISACMGPRHSAYRAGAQMTAAQAEAYHRLQVETLAGTTADVLSAMTMNDPSEAIGIMRAARAVAMPAVVSFTVETDGRLISGMTVREAIERIDDATAGFPLYYMLNCAHPQHFEGALAPDGAWLARIRGLRANASAKSHAELDAADTLDRGEPAVLARHYAALIERLPHVNIVGGCCGTDVEHAECIAAAVGPLLR